LTKPSIALISPMLRPSLPPGSPGCSVDGSPGEPAILPSDANLGVGEAAAICLAAALGHRVPHARGDEPTSASLPAGKQRMVSMGRLFNSRAEIFMPNSVGDLGVHRIQENRASQGLRRLLDHDGVIFRVCGLPNVKLHQRASRGRTN